MLLGVLPDSNSTKYFRHIFFKKPKIIVPKPSLGFTIRIMAICWQAKL